MISSFSADARRFIVCMILMLGVLFSVAANAAANGIFADFRTSLGLFTCELDYSEAPRTVANFMALATGQRAWVDPRTGAPNNSPFYDGLTFHRVIGGFMNQSGSRNGQGTDGPGFAVLDEFSALLRHDSAGVLSMANSGPDSNGAQFFVTAAPTPHLDGVHSVFGRVVEGLDVVMSINGVQTDASDRPLEPVILERVEIRRVGAEAEAFDIHAQELPAVGRIGVYFSRAGGSTELAFTHGANASVAVAESADLAEWTVTQMGIHLAEETAEVMTLPGDARSGFYGVTQVQYASSTRAPASLAGRSMVLVFDGNLGTLSLDLGADGGGTYDFSGTPGTVTSYTWSQEPYRGRLWPIQYSGLFAMTLRMDFATELSGTFSGTVYSGTPFTVTGSFSLAVP
jgi:cyclophilin family peptidyl-prolyl cis-trans isomerase